MKINTDWFLKTGYSHKICQDYVLTGPDYIILADGCSSSEHVDIGARILCQCARNYIETFVSTLMSLDTTHVGKSIIMSAKVTCDSLSLPRTCLDSTLLFMVNTQNYLVIYMFGDGSFITTRDGIVNIRTIISPQNAPFYLSYLLDIKRMQVYENNVGFKNKFERIGIKDGTSEDIYEKEIERWYATSIKKDQGIDNILLTSDGISSFIDFSSGSSISIDKTEIVKQLTSFKNFKGEFIRRRASKMMDEFEKNKIKHYDDFSVVGFHFQKII
jgi:hypothetical protein